MQEILNWTIDTIRKEAIVDSTWLEEQKFEWTPLVVKSLKSLIDDNCTVLILTDNDRQWFGQYILNNINEPTNGRPNLPFYDFKALCINYQNIHSQEDIQLILDMLNISFPNGYIFWYIGKGEDKHCDIAKRKDNSYHTGFAQKIIIVDWVSVDFSYFKLKNVSLSYKSLLRF
jgi:hypothetical protein